MSVFVRDGDLKTYFKKAPVTSIIIILNTFMLLVTLVTGGFTSLNLLYLGGLWAPLVRAGEYYRIITSMFLHGSVIHYVSNVVIGLYVLSSALERIIGSKKFFFIYLLGGIGSGLLVTFTTDHLTIGASGAIFAALGALLYITIYRTDLMSKQEIQSIRSLVIINIVFTFLGSNISISGHLGGIITGFILSYLLIQRNKFIKTDYSNDDVFDFTVYPEDYDKYDDDNERYS